MSSSIIFLRKKNKMIKEGMKEGWEYKRFDDIMTPAKVERCGNREGIKVLSITMRSGIIEQNERFSKSIASKDRSNYKIVKNGQLVIAFPIDEGLIFTQDIADEGIMSPAYNIWDVNYSLVNRKFLVAYFHSPFAFSYYRAKLRGSTQRRRSMDKGDLLSMPIPVPSLNIQEKIVSELDLLSGVIEKQKAQLEELDKLAQSIFHDMFGGKKWEEKRIKDIAFVKIGPFGSALHQHDYITGGTPLVNPIHMINGKIIPDNDFTIDDRKKSELSAYLLKENDIVFGRRGDIGRCALVTKQEDGFLCGTGSLLVRFKIDINPLYSLIQLSAKETKDYLINNARGATMLNLNSSVIEGISIPLPPLTLQQEFAAKVEAIESMKAKVRLSLKEAETLLNSRMDYYFN